METNNFRKVNILNSTKKGGKNIIIQIFFPFLSFWKVTLYLFNKNNLKTKNIINYIFEFNNEQLLKIELYALLDNLKDYIEKKIVFSIAEENNIFSPIFDANNIIGYCYKYKENYDYNKNNSLSVSNSKLLNLYYNYKIISKEINVKNTFNYVNSNQYYFLINKKTITKIKNDYNYKDFLKKLDDDDKKKKLLSNNKDVHNKSLGIQLTKNELNMKYESELIEQNITSINYPRNKDNIVMLFDDFEKIKEEVIKLFIDKLRIKQENYLECIFGKGKVIIHYDNKLGNKSFISVIGKLDNDNAFINEYILINYLNSLKLYNNSQQS